MSKFTRGDIVRLSYNPELGPMIVLETLTEMPGVAGRPAVRCLFSMNAGGWYWEVRKLYGYGPKGSGRYYVDTWKTGLFEPMPSGLTRIDMPDDDNLAIFTGILAVPDWALTWEWAKDEIKGGGHEARATQAQPAAAIVQEGCEDDRSNSGDLQAAD